MPAFPFPSCLFFCLGAAALRPSLCWRGGSTRRPRGRSFRRTLPEEVHKFRVHFVGMRPIYGVRPIFYGGQAGARDQLGGLFARGVDRYDAIGVVVCFPQGHLSRITKAGIVQAPWESLPAKGFNTSKRFKTSGEWQWLSTRPGDIE